MNSSIVTVVSITAAIVFCMYFSKVDTDSQNVFAQLTPGNITSVHPQYITIKSNTHWAGSIFDSSRDSTVMGSYGNARFDIDCTHGFGPYSLVFHKEGGSGYLTVSLVKEGKVLDTQTTTDSFGGIQMSGKCEIIQ